MTSINIPIPQELHRELKLQSILQDKPLKNLIIEYLEQYVRREGKQ